MSGPTQVLIELLPLSSTGLSPFVALLSRSVRLNSAVIYDRSYNPIIKIMVWALPSSLAATSRISIDFFSGRYLDVSVPYVGSSSATLLTEGSIRLSTQGVAPFRNLRVTA